MLDVAEFLLARIAEDEALKGVWSEMSVTGEDRAVGLAEHEDVERCRDAYERRIKADAESKREMILFALRHGSAIDSEFGCCHDEEALRTGFRDWGCGDDPEPVPDGCLGVQAAREGLLILATPYADHPDYRGDWGI